MSGLLRYKKRLEKKCCDVIIEDHQHTKHLLEKRQQKFNQNNKGVSMNSEANNSQQYKNKNKIKCQICNKYGHSAKVCKFRNNYGKKDNKYSNKNNNYKKKNNDFKNNGNQANFCVSNRKEEDPEKYIKFAIGYDSDEEKDCQSNFISRTNKEKPPRC